jgi:hypothetical protein
MRGHVDNVNGDSKLLVQPDHTYTFETNASKNLLRARRIGRCDINVSSEKLSSRVRLDGLAAD